MDFGGRIGTQPEARIKRKSRQDRFADSGIKYRRWEVFGLVEDWTRMEAGEEI